MNFVIAIFLIMYLKYAIFKIADCKTAFYNREPRGAVTRGADTRAYRHLPKSKILAAPLGARTRFARLGGAFSAAEPAVPAGHRKNVFHLKSLTFTIG